MALADLCTEIEQRVTPAWYAAGVLPEGPDFREVWWDLSDEYLPRVRRLTLEIPDARLRDRLDTVVEALDRMVGVQQHSGIADEQLFVQTVARHAAELAGAWLRDEDPDEYDLAMDERLRKALTAVQED